MIFKPKAREQGSCCGASGEQEKEQGSCCGTPAAQDKNDKPCGCGTTEKKPTCC